MTERIFEIEYQPDQKVVLRFRMPGLFLIPEPSRGHFRTASKEALLALRSLLDWAIERAEETEGIKKKTKIDIQ